MKRIDLHPLPLRIWHWISALIVILLIATGLYLRLHGIAALKPHDPALLWHKGLGFASIAATVFWFVYTMSNGKLRRHYRIERSDLRGGIAQMKFYLVSILKGEANPFQPSAANKYNPLQKAAYDTVMFVVMPVQAVTGLLFFDIPPVRRYLLSGNLIGWIGAVHVLFTYLLVLYLIVHLYMSTLGETFFSHTKAMIVGYEEQDEGMTEDEDSASAPAEPILKTESTIEVAGKGIK